MTVNDQTDLLSRGFGLWLKSIIIDEKKSNNYVIGSLSLKGKPTINCISAEPQFIAVKQSFDNKIISNLLIYYDYLIKCTYCYKYYINSKNIPCDGFRPDCHGQHLCNQIDDSDIDKKDIEVVMSQTGRCHQCSVQALRNHENDTVDAIIELTIC